MRHRRSHLIAPLLVTCVVLATFATAAVAEGMITARGEMRDDVAEFMTTFTLGDAPSHVAESNRFDLKFPVDGGTVSGSLSISGREDVSEFAEVACIARRATQAKFFGKYDEEENLLSGTGEGRWVEGPVTGCGGSRYARRKSQPFTFRWSATVQGKQLEGKFLPLAGGKSSGSQEFPFTANLSEVTGSSAERDLQEGLRGTDSRTARQKVDQIAACSPDDDDPKSRCRRALRYAAEGVDSFYAITSKAGSAALDQNLNTLRLAAYLAALRGKDGKALFPVARVTLPVLVRMLARSARAKTEDAAHRSSQAAARFVQLIIRAELEGR